MRIRCKLERKGGTEVDMGDGRSYCFAPDPETGAHVANVDDRGHLSCLLAIADAYEVWEGDPGELATIRRQELAGVKPSGVTGDEPENPRDDRLPDDPEQWTNTQCEAWAKSQGLNPKSKKDLTDYARDNYGVDIDRRRNPANMIREIAKASVALEHGDGVPEDVEGDGEPEVAEEAGQIIE